VSRRLAHGLAAVLFLVLVPTAAMAEPRTTLGAEYGRDTLDNGSPDWSSTAVSLAHQGPDGSVNLEWRGVERFGLDDQQWVVGGHAPVSDTIGLGVEFVISADPVVLPEFGTMFDIDVRLPGAFVAHLGGRRADYPEDTSTALVAGLEYYRGALRAAASVVSARLESGDSGTAHVLQLDRYYGDGSRIGLLGALGDEATRIGPGAVVVADVSSVAIVGRHWLGAAWGISYAVSRTEQGDFYTRRGGTLGLLFRY